MRKSKFLFLSLASIAVLSQADISVEPGWGMYSFNSDTNLSEVINDTNLKIVWAWDAVNSQWKAFSPNADIMSLIQSTTGVNQFFELKYGDGCWILNQGDTNVSIATNAVDTAALYVAQAIAGSSSGLAGAGSASQGAVGNLSSSTSSLGTLSRVLYTPSYTINENGAMVVDMPNIALNSDGQAIIQFSLNANDVNASDVLDSTGGAYGVTDLPTTLTNLGSFFSGLLSAPDYQTYVAQNITSHITAVNTHKGAPLFAVMGSNDFQSFMNSFPTDEASAYSADYATLASNFGALNLQTSLPIANFSKIDMSIAVSMLSSMSVGNATITLPTLKTSGKTLQNIINNDPMTLYGEGNGTISLDSGTAYMSNIELNVSVDASGNPSSMLGKYDITVTKDGHTYTGTPTFNENGCLGADIYEGSTFINRMKIFDDGLWIVDSNNTKIQKVQ